MRSPGLPEGRSDDEEPRRRDGAPNAIKARFSSTARRRTPATASACATASAKAAPTPLPDYELLELLLFRALPRRDTKDLAKRLLARFGSFAEVINAPEPRLKECNGVGDSVITELKLVRAAALRLMRSEIVERPVLRRGTRCSTICAPRRASRTASSSASCSSTSATTSSPTRCKARAPSTTRPSTSAKW